MAGRDEITSYLDTHLELHAFTDHCMNGVEIEGKDEVRRIAVAVDAGCSVIEEACRRGCDLLLVHHGLYWGTPWPIKGRKKQMLSLALSHGLTLYAAHLPLDAHREHGNNAQLARLLGLTDLTPCAPHGGRMTGYIGTCPQDLSCKDLAELLATLPGALNPMLILPFGPEHPRRVCIVSGAACDQLHHAAEDGFDTFITGEPRQSAYHYAKEEKLNVIFGGHYATETVGPRALGAHLAERFGVTVEFIDEPTGI